MTTEASTVAPAAAASTGLAAPSTYSEASERMILATALNEDRRPLLNRLLSLISNDDFYLDQHKVLWSCVRTLNDANQPHDAVALLDFTSSRQLFVGGVEYLMTLRDDPLAAVTSDEAVDAAAKRIKDYATLRRLVALFKQGEVLCASGRAPEDILGVVEDDLRNLRKLSQSSRSGPEHIRTAIGAVVETIYRQMDGEAPAAISTGHQELDDLIFGFCDGDLIILAARPSMGKTAGMMDLARNIGTRMGTDSARKVLIFSTEMEDEALGRRALAREGRIDLGRLRSGQLGEEEISRLSDAAYALQESGVYIDDTPGLTLAEIRARARAFVAEHGKCVIMVDYLQNVSAPEGMDTRAHVGMVSNGLKLLARELAVPVMALSQLSRGLEQRANKRPLMSDLRESGNIEQDADVIIFMYRDEYYNPDSKEPGICEWIVAKQRDGAVGTVKLGFQKTTGVFFSVTTGAF